MSDKKACQFCGEEILVVALKCKHCGSNLAVGALNAGNSAAATSTSDDERESSNEPSYWTQLAVYGVIFVIGVGLLATNPSRDEFKSFLNQKIEGGIEKVLFKASSDKDTQGILGSIVKGIASAAMSKILHRQNYYVFSIFELDTSLIRAIGVDVPQVKFLGIAGNFIPLNQSSWERITNSGAAAAQDMSVFRTCSGTEPFWDLTIENDELKFQHEGLVMELKGVKAGLAKGAPVSAIALYQGKVVGKDRFLNVIITQDNQCSDGRSNDRYRARVYILSGNYLYTGCCK